MSPTTLGDYERAARPPTDEALVRDLADALGLGAEELVRTWRQAAMAYGRRRRRVPPLPPVLEQRLSEPLVGRERTLRTLDGIWQRVRAGGRSMTVITGEPGVGKSRMAAEFARRAHVEGGNVLFGHCDEDGAASYQPFHEALAGFVRGRPAEELRSLVGRRGPDLARLVPEVNEQLGSVPAERWGDPKVDRYEMFEAVVAVLAGTATSWPVVLVLDDLHWATQPSLLLLRHIVHSSASVGLLILAVLRDTEAPSGVVAAEIFAAEEAGVPVQHFALEGLSPSEVADLVANELPGEHDLEPVSAAIHAQTDGNPFYVRAILHDWLLGALERASPERDLTSIPTTVLSAVQRRIERLSERTRRLLTVAAVAGPAVPLALLRRFPGVVERSSEIVEALDEATRRGVLREAPGSLGVYAFDHELTRRSIESRLSVARRLHLHTEIAQALERLPDASERIGAIAHHYAEAAAQGDVDPALRTALGAAEFAMRSLAFEDAIATLDRALDTQRYGQTTDPGLLADVYLARAEACLGLIDFSGYRDAVFHAAQIAEAIESVTRLGRAATLLGRWGPFLGRPDAEGVELCERALALLGDDDDELRARIQAGLARRLALSEGRGWRAEPLATAAVDLARRVNDPMTLADALTARGYILQGSPQVDEQTAIGDELISVGAQASNVLNVHDGHHIRLRARFERADLAGVLDDVRALDDLASQQRSSVSAAMAEMYRGALALVQGRFDEVDQHAMATLGSDNPNFSAVGTAQIFFARWEQGRLEELRSPLEAMVEQNPGLVIYRVGQAVLEADLGNPDESRSIIADLATDDFAGVPRDLTWTGSLTLLTELCVSLGERPYMQQLHDLLEPHRPYLAVAATTATATGAVARYLAMLEWMHGDWRAADAGFEAARQQEIAMNADALVARTDLWHSRMLESRRWAGDRERALEMAGRAFDTTTRLGMRNVHADAATLRTRLLRQ